MIDGKQTLSALCDELYYLKSGGSEGYDIPSPESTPYSEGVRYHHFLGMDRLWLGRGHFLFTRFNPLQGGVHYFYYGHRQRLSPTHSDLDGTTGAPRLGRGATRCKQNRARELSPRQLNDTGLYRSD